MKPMNIAHRGFSSHYPENSMLAFEGAWLAGADMIEFDVRMSADGHIIVFHDETLERMTDGWDDMEIQEKGLKGISKIKLRSYSQPTFNKEGIPFLRDVLKFFKGKLQFNIEIKPMGDNKEIEENALVDKIYEIIQQEDVTYEVVISSFSEHILTLLSNKDSKLKLGVLDSCKDDSRISWIDRFSAYSYHPKYQPGSPDLINQAKSKGMKIFPYTIDHVQGYEELRSWGVDGIITNNVILLKECSIDW